MILVTGGTGVIGSELLRLLSQRESPHAPLSGTRKKRRNCLASYGLSEIWLRPETFNGGLSRILWLQNTVEAAEIRQSP